MDHERGDVRRISYHSCSLLLFLKLKPVSADLAGLILISLPSEISSHSRIIRLVDR
jgi:hypothetical protein